MITNWRECSFSPDNFCSNFHFDSNKKVMSQKEKRISVVYVNQQWPKSGGGGGYTSQQLAEEGWILRRGGQLVVGY